MVSCSRRVWHKLTRRTEKLWLQPLLPPAETLGRSGRRNLTNLRVPGRRRTTERGIVILGPKQDCSRPASMRELIVIKRCELMSYKLNVSYFTEEVEWSLAKIPLNFNGGLATLGLISM